MIAASALGLVACAGQPAANTGTTPLVAPDTADVSDANSAATRAADAWQRRSERGGVVRALEAYQELLRQSPDDAVAVAGVARAAWLRGRLLQAEDPGEAQRQHAQGRDVVMEWIARTHPGRAAEDGFAPSRTWLGQVPTSVLPALYWGAVNAQAWAQRAGFAQQILGAAWARAIFDACAERVPELDDGGPDRQLGSMTAAPLDFALRDLQASERHFATALRLGAERADNHLARARDYAVAAQDRELLESELRLLLSPNDESPVLPETRAARRQAQALAEGASELFE